MMMHNGLKLLSYAALLAGSALTTPAHAADYLSCTSIKLAKDRLACFDRFAVAQTAEATVAAEAARQEADAKAQAAQAAAAVSAEKAAVQLAVDRFKDSVADRFKDPSSAQFRNVVAYGTAKPLSIDVLCGQVNAKNSYGAYTGFRRFLTNGSASVEIEDTKNTVMDRIWPATCRGDEIYRQ